MSGEVRTKPSTARKAAIYIASNIMRRTRCSSEALDQIEKIINDVAGNTDIKQADRIASLKSSLHQAKKTNQELREKIRELKGKRNAK